MDRRAFLAAGRYRRGGGNIEFPRGRQTSSNIMPAGKFKLKYAPGFGLFEESAGKDPIDQLKFMADEGFSAMFDNDLHKKPPELQEKIVATSASSLISLWGLSSPAPNSAKPTFVLKDNAVRESASH